MIGRLMVILMPGVGLLHPSLAASERSEDERRMKEQVIALSRGAGAVADLRIELMDGRMAASQHYRIADGKIVKQEWVSPGSPEQHDEWAVTDEAVRALLRDLVDKQYWTFEGTRFIPDNTVFLFRLYYKDLQSVDYRCDVDEDAASPQRASIRSALLTFVSGASPIELPGTR